MEKVFFEYDGVKVTNARFINDSNTYAMSGITSVKLMHRNPSYSDVIWLAMFGVAFLVFSFSFLGKNSGLSIFMLALGVLMGVIGYFVYKKKKIMYFIALSTAGGEVEGLISYQPEYVSKVVNALNDAIVYRE